MSLTGKRNRVSNYYSTSQGKIVKSLGKVEPDNMEGVTSRVNKNGETVYEILSDYITGHITGAEFKLPPEDKPDWGSQMVLELTGEDGEKAKVNIPFDSAYGRGFLYVSPNIDLSLEVEIEPYKYFSKKKGKDILGLNIFQSGKKLDWAFGTKANTGGMPPLEKVKHKGKDTWDNTKQLEFLRQKFEEFAYTLAQTETPSTSTQELEVNPTAETVDADF